jgi:hypothetical protein
LTLPAAGICALIAAGCGSAAPARVPTVSELARLRAHLADAQTAAAHHDRQAATAALDALGADVALLRREGLLSSPLATTLATDVAQARRRAVLELPPPAPVAPVTTTPAATATPAPVAVPPAGGADQGKPKDHGKPPDHPQPPDHKKPKDHGGG